MLDGVAFTLRVGQHSASLLAEQRRRQVECSAFITAWNPFSQSLSAAENASRQTELARELARQGLSFLKGVGQHPSNDWPGEDSLLVFGLSRDAARALGTRLEQNAIVWSGSDAVPELILLR